MHIHCITNYYSLSTLEHLLHTYRFPWQYISYKFTDPHNIQGEHKVFPDYKHSLQENYSVQQKEHMLKSTDVL
jgi:hypothetical protein